MKVLDINTKAFLKLVRAGLWETEVQLLPLGDVDYHRVFKIAEEQSVVGILAAGIEHASDVNIPKENLLQFIGNTLQLEQRNLDMNSFLGMIIEKMRKAGIYTVIIKGQGVAQSYERPLWRTVGDVDFLLSKENYQKAEMFLRPLASRIEEENKNTRHIAMMIEPWEVELHGSLRGGLWDRLDNGLEEIQYAVFYEGKVRSWMNGKIQIFLPGADEDVVLVFAHILQHFFRGGVGLRQIFDWCRLLWMFNDRINRDLLRKRLNRMGVMTEWKAYASLAVDFLGMPADAMPFYEHSIIQKRKAGRILSFVMETGNFGHNRDRSFYFNKPFLVRKAISFWRNTCDSIKFISIFPMDTIRIWVKMFKGGLIAALRCRG